MNFALKHEFDVLRLTVLGAFSVSARGHIAIDISSRKCRALLTYLAMHPGVTFSREHLASLFWGHVDDAAARQSLRQCKLVLGKLLLPHCPGLFIESKDQLGIAAGKVSVDALELALLPRFDDAVDVTLLAELRPARFLECVKDGDGDFDAWVALQAETLSLVTAHLLTESLKRSTARGQDMLSLQLVNNLVAIDPLREDWQRLSISLHAKCWGKSKALTKAHDFVRRLRRELDVAPDSATLALIDEIAGHGHGAATLQPLAC